MEKIVTNNVFMVSPNTFLYDPETAVNNFFQKEGKLSPEQLHKQASRQFWNLVDQLTERGIRTQVLEDDNRVDTPSIVFPADWFCTNNRPEIYFFRTEGINRRLEAVKLKDKVLSLYRNLCQEEVTVHDLRDEHPLEGQGSVIHDPYCKRAYAALSPRTDRKTFEHYCVLRGYQPVMFTAECDGHTIHHTNRMMSICENFIFICLDAVPSSKEREALIRSLSESGKIIIDVDMDQMKRGAASVIELGPVGKSLLLISKSGFQALTDNQKMLIHKYDRLFYADISVFEEYGGAVIADLVAPIYYK